MSLLSVEREDVMDQEDLQVLSTTACSQPLPFAGVLS